MEEALKEADARLSTVGAERNTDAEALAAALEANTGLEEDLASALEANTGLEEDLASALASTCAPCATAAQVDTLENERDAAILAQVQAVTAQREAENELEAIEDDQTRWQFRMDQANAATELERSRKERAQQEGACYRESSETLFPLTTSARSNVHNAWEQAKRICEQHEYMTSACIAQTALDEAMDTMREAMPASCV